MEKSKRDVKPSAFAISLRQNGRVFSFSRRENRFGFLPEHTGMSFVGYQSPLPALMLHGRSEDTETDLEVF
jgi:hypothetical protein